ncbi:hypothetical protein QN277_020082 [Acacia crassicarpa]|uniref:Uncharacterized protein n=1 Tax=Acacia crassicarpa TaxID=499986 RepID=A0AAE1JJ11_9FABA|nr:hypothetical protein QN277_020082 [Acacia crassicarpa]
MASGLSLTRGSTAVFPDEVLYRTVVGSLQYVTITRPDICFAVNKVCQFMQTPYIEHWKVVKRILRYLAGSINHGLILCLSPTTSLVAFCDADWAADKDDRKSMTGYCIYFGSNLVLWSSKNQCTVSRSSTEAEYRSMASTVAELLWLQSLHSELHIKLVVVGVPYVLCDKLSAVMITTNPVLYARTKHLELDLHFVRERAIRKEIRVQHIPSTSHVADGLTKAISCLGFPLFKEQLC